VALVEGGVAGSWNLQDGARMSTPTRHTHKAKLFIAAFGGVAIALAVDVAPVVAPVVAVAARVSGPDARQRQRSRR